MKTLHENSASKLCMKTLLECNVDIAHSLGISVPQDNTQPAGLGLGLGPEARRMHCTITTAALRSCQSILNKHQNFTLPKYSINTRMPILTLVAKTLWTPNPANELHSMLHLEKFNMTGFVGIGKIYY